MDIKDKLLEVITQMQSGVNKAGDFAMEQLPDIVQSYVAYGRISMTAYMVIGLIFACIFAKFGHVGWTNGNLQQGKGNYGDDGTGYFSIGLICYAICVIITIVLVGNIGDLILIYVAPKVWLMKELVNLVKVMK